MERIVEGSWSMKERKIDYRKDKEFYLDLKELFYGWWKKSINRKMYEVKGIKHCGS